MKKLSCFLVWLILGAASNVYAEGACSDLFPESDFFQNHSLDGDEFQGAGNPSAAGLYTPIYAKGQDVLSSFKFDEGPSPQRNMSIPPEPKDQYVFTSDTAEIFRQKAAITKRNGSRVIQYLEGYDQDVINAVREQFDRMLEEFGKFYPDIYRVNGDSITNKITGDRVTRRQVFAKNKGPYELLELVGKLVQEDWLLMKKNTESGEYHLIGGYLAFPTHWSLDRAIGWGLTQIHANIPGTPESRAKFIGMIAKVLDMSLAAPDRVVVRNNWFVESDPRYALPDYIRSKSSEEQSIEKILASSDSVEAKKEKLKKLLCLRIERQTLRGLPGSGVVVFSINPYVFKLATVLENPQVAARVARGLQLKFPDATQNDVWGMAQSIMDETSLDLVQPK